MKSPGSPRHQGPAEFPKAFEDAVQALLMWHQSITAAIEEVCEELRQAADVLLPLDTSINSAGFNTISAKDDFGASHFSSRNVGKRALRGNAKAEHSQVRWPTELEDLLFRIPILIEEYLKQALKAEGDDEAMRYIMAARILFMAIKGLMDLKVRIVIDNVEKS